MTFSIVARDPETGDFGVAVQSKFLAVGAVVPWAQARVGAIATQALANTGYGPKGLELLKQGLSPQDVLAYLINEDEGRDERQVGIIGVDGPPTSFTGTKCFDWAGGKVGEHYACQGNILVSEATITAIAETFERATGDLWDRLLSALAAGQAAGGDSRGQQSAALLVVREKGGYGGFTDQFINLRIDDHPDPITELQRLLALHKLYLFQPATEDILPIDQTIANELQQLLTSSGDYQGEQTGSYDTATQAALRAYTGRENLEERWFDDARIDRVVLEFIRQQIRGETKQE